MKFTPPPRPNYDAIHQKALSLIASNDYYEICTQKYAAGTATAIELAEALELYQNDCADFVELCRGLQESVILIAVKGEIYALEINAHYVLVKIKRAVNVSGGLDEIMRGERWIEKF